MTGASLEGVDERVVEGVERPIARDGNLDAMPGLRVVDRDHHVVARRAPEQRDAQAVGAPDRELAPGGLVRARPAAARGGGCGRADELAEVDDPAAAQGEAGGGPTLP